MDVFRLLTIFLAIVALSESKGIFSFNNWKYHFPHGSGQGIFLAIALPLNLPDKSVYMAYNFEASYPLPFNQTIDEYPPTIFREGRGIDRKVVYDVLEAKMDSQGVSGKQCLLRTICEASALTLQENGVIGDLLHILFSPSTTSNPKDLSADYVAAETTGRSGNCMDYTKTCPVSFLNLISWIGRAF